MTDVSLSPPTPTPTSHSTCRHLVYKLTCPAFDQLVSRAGGKCERCGVPELETRRRRLVIDHDHYIGWHAVRGLLCSKCNTHLGRVDAGRALVDEQTAAYLLLSEAGRTPRSEDAVPVTPASNNRMVRIGNDQWGKYGAVVGDRGRSNDINAYVKWRNGHPGAGLGDISLDRTHVLMATVRESPSGRRVEVKVVYGEGGQDGANLCAEIAQVITEYVRDRKHKNRSADRP